MASIESCFAGSNNGPYDEPLRVQVLAQGNEITYQTTNGELKKCLNVSVSDGKHCAKATIYDQSKYSKMKPGKCVVLRHVIKKLDDDNMKCLIITKPSKVIITGPVPVSTALVEEGKTLINPPPAPVKPVIEAIQSPPKKKVSIEGRVVQEEQDKHVKVRGHDVPIKEIYIEDGTGKVKLTMWRDAINKQVHVGDHVVVTDVVTNLFKNETSLSTTALTKVQKTDAPLKTETVSMVGISLEEDKAELLCADDRIIQTNSELLHQAFPTENLELLTTNGPVTVAIQSRGNEVLGVLSDHFESDL